MAAAGGTTSRRLEIIDWGVAARPHPDQPVCGDHHVVVPVQSGAVLAVIDGLGHGDDAVAASRAAAGVIERFAEEPLVALVRHCHEALQRTRGAVLTIVGINAHENVLSAIGIGNVETAVVRADTGARARREGILLRCGVVGYQLPLLRPSLLAIAPGDTIVFATDGVWEDFSDLVVTTEPPAVLAERILAQRFRGTDDGLVLACRYLGLP